MFKKIKSLFHCLHKNGWIGEYKYIEDSIQHTFTRIDADDGYISAKYEVNVITSNRSTIADKLMAKFYSQYTGLKYFQFKDLRSARTHVVFSDILNLTFPLFFF